MEKENFQEYYELIVSLIKEHKKYVGLESILEDIVADVYQHSEVILGSVNNKDVVISYLKKVVATSIITVPKKKNINVTVKKAHPVIDLTRPEKQDEIYKGESFNDEDIESKQSVDLVEETKDADVQQHVTKETVSEAVSEAVSTDVENDIVIDDLDAETQNQNTENEIEETIEELYSESVVSSLDEVLEIASEPEEQQLLEEVQSPNNYVNIELVEKMINGVDSVNNEKVLQEDNTLEEEQMKDEFENEYLSNPQTEGSSFIINEQEAELLEIEEEFVNNFDNEELSISDVIENSVETEEEILNEPNTIAENESEILDEEFLEEQDEQVVSTEDIDIFVETEDVDLLEVDGGNLVAEGDSELYATEELLVENENGDSENSIAPQLEVNSDMYSCFSFDPGNIVEEINNYYDGEEIYKELLELDKSYPQYQVLKLYNLRFVDGLSIEKIAEHLSQDINSVIETLNVIIDIVKD